MSDPLLPPDAAAERLGVSEPELRAAIAVHAVPYYDLNGSGKLLRFEWAELVEAWPPEGWSWPPPDPPLPVRVPKAPARVGWIYFIGDTKKSPVKIGWAVDPARRLVTLQTGCWVPLSIHGAVRGTVLEEKDLHRRLRRHRMHGEWFRRGPALRLLESLRDAEA